MTDRIKGFWVALDEDIREDDVQPVINAVKCIKHVAAVGAHVADHNDWMARQQVRHQIWQHMWKALKEVLDGKETDD